MNSLRARNVPKRLRLRRGGGGGVGGCGGFVPRREISTSTRETVSPEAMKIEHLKRRERQGFKEFIRLYRKKEKEL